LSVFDKLPHPQAPSLTKGFQVKSIFRRWLNNFKTRISRRLDKSKDTMTFEPEFKANNIHYETSSKIGAISCGGIGAIHLLTKRLGLAKLIDQRLQLLKIHLPYQDSDHVLNIAYNALCGGECLQDLELRRNDENYLNALGTRRIPDPTTAGDYCRRFTAADCFNFIDIVNDVRRQIWARQPKEFFKRATINMDGTLTETLGECKKGMGIAYNGDWCYHPLLLTLAETREVLSIVNRSGNRPSHEGAAAEVDRAIALCDNAGFEKIVLRGDTDFSQTLHLDRWDNNPKIRFVFGYNRTRNLEEIAANLPESEWRRLERPARYQVKTQPRRRPINVKEQIVKEREYENKRLDSEDVAEFLYQPIACRETYRMVVIRKNISVEKGEQVLFPQIVYFFYITNEWEWTPSEVVFEANGRCNHENDIAQLKNAVRALHAPLDNLESNWAYMLMTSLAWNLKAWWALTLPEAPGRWHEQHHADKQWTINIEFKTFLNAFMLLPCQIIRTGRKLVYRLLSCNPRLSIFFRLLHELNC
jgi:Transposase DDE domain group 1